MNKIYKVMYSKVKQCAVVVSEIAKSHGHNGESSGVRKHAALTAAVLIALGSLSFTTAFVPMTAEAAVKTRTDGSNFVGVERTDGLFEDSDYANHNGQGAHGDDSITIGLKASGGDGTITIGDRRAEKSLGSVYVGRGPGMPTGKVLPSETDDGYWATSVGYQSDATGYGSIAIGSNATAKNSYDKDSTGHGIQLRVPSGDGSITLNGEPDIQRASVAIGYGASADNGNIAIGSYSDASTDLRTAKTPDGEEIKSYLTDNKADSYVSVGKTGALRRISNVADGAADSDAATIAQLKKAVEETDASKKANIDASNIGENLKKADGKTAADSSDKKNNKDAWGNAIGTGKVEKNNGQLVTGGTVYSALENQKKDLSVHAGWGISVAKDKDGKAISLNRNLGRDAYTKDKAVLKADENKSALVIGGRVNPGDATGGQTAEKDYGALGQDSVTVGGADNTVRENGDAAVVVGGVSNTASAQYSTVIGGSANDALGNQSSVFGGHDNDAHGTYSTASGGSMNRAYGTAASVFGGGVNSALGDSSVAVGGLQSTVNGTFAVGIAGGSTNADYALAAGNGANVTVENGTAIGYQATTDEAGTIAFGHDAGDAYYSSTTWPQKATKQNGKYYDANNKEISKAKYDALKNSDGTWNDYSKTPTVVEKTYDKAAYNRLVKVADGQDDHDVVVMEQLTKATNDLTKDLSVNPGWGINVADEKDTTGKVTKNVISLNRNLGTNYGNPWKGEGKVTFEAGGENSMILGGAASILFNNEEDNVKAGAYGKDSVLVGGFNNLIDTVANDVTQTGEDAVIVGGDTNTVTGLRSVIVGGSQNKVSGGHSIVIGGASNETDGGGAGVFGGQLNKAAGGYSSVLGGDHNEADGDWSSAIGGTTNTASGLYATTLGGKNNDAKGKESVVVGGGQNVAIGEDSTVNGGAQNTSYGMSSYVAGGMNNMAFGNASVALGGIKSNVNAKVSTGIAGGSTEEKAITALAAGHQSVVTNSGVEWRKVTQEDFDAINQKLPSWSGFIYTEPEDPYTTYVLDKVSTAVGYQSTADAPGVIAFGHDKGDVASVAKKWKQKATMEVGDDYSAKFYDANHKEISAEDYYKLANADGTLNDYTQDPIGTENTTYQSAYYNRLVKAADGIDAHDAVVMEQLKPYTKSDASNIGANLKTYTVGDDGETITETDATADQKKTYKDAWGKALGAEPFTTGTDTTVTNASTSDQLVTGKTLYNYDAPVAETGKNLNYVSANNTTGQNLSALDAQVADNASKLNDKTHNIKYYSVNDKKSSTQETLPTVKGLLADNSDNKGAKGMGSLASGFSTEADGIASTVAGSYSGVINQNGNSGLDFRGAAALSYGTFNVNQNTADTAATKTYSGVANSIVGQANMTTDSNAAIIYGAGNTVTNSYRPIDPKKAGAILDNVSNPTNLGKAMQDAVKDSGGQVMVMGGGNNVESAYMSQVVGVGNTVKGNQVKNTEGEWATDTSDTAIKDYDSEKSSQYNYVDGFNNEVINGKHDYIIGANNKLDGDSYDDNNAKPIKRSNKSNVVIGDNHALTGKKNNVIIGSADTEGTLTRASDAVIIGHNANATSDTGADNAVAIGLSATAGGGNAVTIGVNTSAGDNSITIGSESSAISGSNIAIGRYARVYGDKVTNAVALGYNANAKVADGVAIGSGSEATVTGKSTEGYDPTTGKNSTETTSTWQATNAAVSIGTVDGKVTRQINGVAAGTNETDAVNVAQLKNATAGMTTKGLNFQGNNTDVTVHRDLGSTLTIKGNGTKDDSSYSADNIKVVGDANGSLTIMMDKEIKGDRITVGEKGEPGKEGQAGKDGVDGQIGVNGKDGSAVVINGKDGSIGLNGKDGANGLTIKGAKGDAGVDETDGHDGKDGMTRIVYEDHNKVTHKVATLDDGMKYAGDFGDGAAVKLDKTVNIKGNVKEGAKSDDFVDGNIAVVANKKGDNGELQIKLNKNLTGLNSATYTTTTGEGESAKTSTTTVDGNGLTIMNGPSITNNGVDAGKKAITNVGNGIEKDSAGKYTVTDQNKGNAANIGDVQNMVNEAVNSAADTTNKALAGKANVDASNIGANLKGEDGKTPATEEEMTKNENAWGSAIGTGKIEANNGQLVTGKTVYEYNKPVAENGKPLNYVSEGKTTGQNLGALDAQVKNNADAIKKNSESIQNITNNVKNLSDNAVQYDKDSNKTKVTLGGEGGTTITNVKDGALSDSSSDAVNGKQLYNEQEARKAADKVITEKVTNNTNEITKIKDGEGFTDKGKTVIKSLAQDAVDVKGSDNVTVTNETKDGTKTFTVSVDGNGKVASGDKGLISGDTIYNELRPSADGSYIKKDSTTAQNLVSLDTQVKKTSDLINSDGKTIKIGGSDAATKIDVNGKDGKGRVITGVVSDANDPTSAANVGYVNGVTAANTQQIYRDMNNAYGRLNNNINKAAAGSNALAALHPLDYDPDDKADFAVGYGHYRNANAAAVGAFYHPNENTMVNVGVSLGNGDPGFNAGVSFKVGRGGAGREAMSKTEMAKVINSQSKEIDALKKDNADKDKRIDALEQKMAEILAKLDKNGK